MMVKALGKQRNEVYPKQKFGDKVLQIPAFLKNHVGKIIKII